MGMMTMLLTIQALFSVLTSVKAVQTAKGSKEHRNYSRGIDSFTLVKQSL
jgi:hypothetical protein